MMPDDTAHSPMITPAPVRKTVTVRAAPAHAFQVFTATMGKWWLKDHSITDSGQADVVVEPKTGGRWYEVGVEGEQCDWGRVIMWDPPGRLILSWQLDAGFDFDPDLATELEVTFTALPGGETRVDLEHRGLEKYGEKANHMAKTFAGDKGWGAQLVCFQQLIAAGDTTGPN
jgi:hypothetical protein